MIAADMLQKVQRLCTQADSREIDRQAFLEQAARLVTAEIDCSRTGIWMFDHSTLHCIAMYDGIKDRMVSASVVTGSGLSAYFQMLGTTGKVVASDARRHYATAGFDLDAGQCSEHRRCAHWKAHREERLDAVRFQMRREDDQEVEWNHREISALQQMAEHFGGTLIGLRQAEAVPVSP